MALDIKNLAVRSISGVVYAGLIIGAFLWKDYGLSILSTVFGVLACYELERNFAEKLGNSRWQVPYVVDVLIIVFPVWFFSHPLLVRLDPILGIMVRIVPLLLVVRLCLQLFLRQRKPLYSFLTSILAYFYIGAPLTLLVITGQLIDPWIGICIIAMIWINDSGAYIVGCSIGRHKMSPTISPNKSWEGLIGGLLFNIGFAFIYFYCFHLRNDWFLSSVGGWIYIGVCVSVFATLGDLFESYLKRKLKIKDFGDIIPGHGGVLDRIDSLLFVVPGLLLMYIIAV